MKKRVLGIILVVIFMFTSICPAFAQNIGATNIKNVIYLIPDGGGMSPFYMADAVKQAGGWDKGVFKNPTPTEKGPMYTKDYLVGAITTYSASSDITDSAAAGTALSSGYKTNTGYVGVDPQVVPHATILEMAQYLGKKTGIVSTYEWSNATPAAFTAHVKKRADYINISEQIVNQGIDVVLGGGFGSAVWGDISEAEIRGYNIINNKSDLENMKQGDKVWGNIVPGSFDYDINKGTDIPSLAEMTNAAIRALDSSENGFFLMVEGSKIDGGGHSNSARSMVSEFLAFDEACKVAIEYAKKRNDTIVVIAPDHDTGGMNLPENLDSAVNTLKLGNEPSDITWTSEEHTGRNCGLFMYVPSGVGYPEGISGKDIGTQYAFENYVVDNTVIANYLADVMGTSLDDITKKLFVDVTNMGTYDNDIGMFVFKDYPLSVRQNGSYAIYKGELVDLEGQINLYINDRFYVPQYLIDIAEGKSDYKHCDYINNADSSYMETYMNDEADVNSWMGKIKVTNLTSEKNMTGKIVFTAPESFKNNEPINIDVPLNTCKAYEFKCPKFNPFEKDLAFEYDIICDDGRKLSFKSLFKGVASASYASDEIVIDGNISDKAWENAVKMKCNQQSDLVMINNWKGERDLSAEFSVLWDEMFVYMYYVVSDEIFSPAKKLSNLLKGDSVEFGIYHDADGKFKSGKQGNKFEEIGIAVIGGKPVLNRYRTQNGTTSLGQIALGSDTQIATSREGDNQIYELKIKWSDLLGNDYIPKNGDVLGFSAVFNDNDGNANGLRGWMEYGSGIGSTKDVSLFVPMHLLNEEGAATENDVKIFVDGKKLKTDVSPVIVDGRTLVPVRAIFEALGANVEWNDTTKTALSTKDNTVVKIQIGNNKINVNNVEKEIDVPAQLVNSRTLVPVRVISESFGFDVAWNDANRAVIITQPSTPAPLTPSTQPSAQVSKPSHATGENLVPNPGCDDKEAWKKNTGAKGKLSVEEENGDKFLSLAERVGSYERIEATGIADKLNQYGPGTYEISGRIKMDGASAATVGEVYILAPSYKGTYEKYTAYTKIKDLSGQWTNFNVTVDTSKLEFTTWPSDTVLAFGEASSSFDTLTKLCIDDISLIPINTKKVAESTSTTTSTSTPSTSTTTSSSNKGEASNVTKDEMSKSILENGTMDKDTGWTLAEKTPKAVTLTYEKEADGNRYIKMAGRTADWIGLEQTGFSSKLKAGKTYIFKMRVKIENDVNAQGDLQFYLLSKSNTEFKIFKKFANIGDGWKNVEFEFTPSSSPSDVRVNMRAATSKFDNGDTANYNMCFDDIVIIEK